jgi:hypothetical protein
VIEELAGASNVDVVALRRPAAKVSNESHVHDGGWVFLAENVFERALSDIHLVERHPRWTSGPRIPIDTDHLVPFEQASREQPAHTTGHTHDQHPLHLGLTLTSFVRIV